ncbi:MAG: WD40 repeat domain-containing protein [Chloroflexi bacterium]|nr:WD40 repeat domain-containing protein [Chloroflexota bacterium]
MSVHKRNGSIEVLRIITAFLAIVLAFMAAQAQSQLSTNIENSLEIIDVSNAHQVRQIGSLGSSTSSDNLWPSVVTFSPDGLRVGVGRHGGSISVYEIEGGAEVFFAETSDELIGGLAFSSDGNTLYSAGGDDLGTSRMGLIYLRTWELYTTEVRETVLLADTLRIPFAVGLGGTALLAVNANQQLYSWRLEEHSRRYVITDNMREIHFGCTALTFSINMDLFACGNAHGEVTILRWETNQSLYSREKMSSSPIAEVEFSSDSTLLASSHENGVIALLDVNSGAIRELSSRQAEKVHTYFAFNPFGSLIVSSTDQLLPHINSRIQLVEVSTGQVLGALDEYLVTDVAFSPAGTMIAVGSIDGSVHLWGVEADS